MKQIYIGTWALSWRNVDLYGREEYGGHGDVLPKDKGNARLEISLAPKEWVDILFALLHETEEFLLNEAGVSFRKLRDCSNDTGNRYFQFSHQELTSINAHQADFIAACEDAVKKAWREFRKKLMPPKGKKIAKKKKSTK